MTFINDVPIEDVVMHTERQNLDVVPATIRLSGAEIELTSQMAREKRLAGAAHATDTLENGETVTVDSSQGTIFRGVANSR